MDKPAFTFQVYDFNLTAGGSQTILAGGAYLRILTATGAVDVIVEGKGTMPNLLAGQGLKDLPFQRVVLRDKSGAPNSGTILVASSEFVDNRLFGTFDLTPATLAALESVDLNAATINSLNRPLAHTGSSQVLATLAASTAETVFSPGSNLNGAILLAAQVTDLIGATTGAPSLLAKSSAPANINDGACYLTANIVDTTSGGSIVVEGSVFEKQFVPAGLGLYWISNTALTANCRRWTRYILL